MTLYNVKKAEPDTAICAGNPVDLKATADPVSKVLTTKENSSSGNQGGMFYLRAHQDVTIDSFAVRFQSNQSIMAEIWGKSGTYRTFEQNNGIWDPIASYYNFTPKPAGQFTVIPTQVYQSIAGGDSFAFYITTVNTPAINMAYSTGNGQQGTVYTSDGIIDFVQGTTNKYFFGAFVPGFGQVLDVRIYYTTKAGLSYVWNTGESGDSIQVRPTQTSEYIITVVDTSGCRSKDTVVITAYPVPMVDAGADTLLCIGQTYQLQAATETSDYFWMPSVGLNMDSILTPIFSDIVSREYVLTAISGINGCTATDTIRIGVLNPGPDTTVCDEDIYVMPATAPSYIQQFLWEPIDGLSNPAILNPVFQSSVPSDYMLTAISDKGSRKTCVVSIGLKPCAIDLEAPQAFTPNDDGHNDHFKIYGNHADEYQVRIYNRWGELVYDSKVITSGLEGLSDDLWDGTFKGKLQDAGTYVYYIWAKNNNSLEVAEKKGNLTLIR
ncbi:MAG: gliding motility-associated C-terminal domain-containing protein [Bacteroidetes bacterium]|nr:gliding motility-associated C-terminal domain-containing protein [Bacteroidota bacterium]